MKNTLGHLLSVQRLHRDVALRRKRWYMDPLEMHSQQLHVLSFDCEGYRSIDAAKPS